MSAGKPASQKEAWSLKRVSGKIRPSKGRKSDSAGKSWFLRKPSQNRTSKAERAPVSDYANEIPLGQDIQASGKDMDNAGGLPCSRPSLR